MIKKKANKLFWDKYLYKLGVYNSGTPIFRNKRLDQARDVIDKLNLQFIAGEPIQWSPTRFSQKSIEISQSDLDDLKILINAFQDNVDYMLRCEGMRLGIYANDIKWIRRIGKKLNDVPWLWEPKNANAVANVIYVDEPFPYEYKVFLNGTADHRFYDWCKSNTDKVRVGDGLLRNFKNGTDLRGKYLYCKNEKNLTLIRMFLHDNIIRLDKIVHQTNTDK